jgi:hypothetical protein
MVLYYRLYQVLKPDAAGEKNDRRQHPWPPAVYEVLSSVGKGLARASTPLPTLSTVLSRAHPHMNSAGSDFVDLTSPACATS